MPYCLVAPADCDAARAVVEVVHADRGGLRDAIADRFAGQVEASTFRPTTAPEREVILKGGTALLAALPDCEAPRIRRAALALAEAGIRVETHRVADDGSTVLLVYEVRSSGGGLSAWRCGPSVDLVLQAPHALHDLGTGRLVRRAFVDGNARGAMWNTHHRYRGAEGERPEDPVHPADVTDQPTSALHTWTLVAADLWPSARFVQVHGFGEGSAPGVAVVSSGDADRPPTGAAEVLRSALSDAVEGPVLTFGRDTDRLGATLNVQGRALAHGGAARFLHVELSAAARGALDEDAARLVALVGALGELSWSW